ncbi:hypothetical protein [Methyloglobulus sp.]|uniref:hypothetical protein n=1 Tax=Methyloglobulus sp. TaxID=2518622 RepID=UPI0032B734C8
MKKNVKNFKILIYGSIVVLCLLIFSRHAEINIVTVAHKTHVVINKKTQQVDGMTPIHQLNIDTIN